MWRKCLDLGIRTGFIENAQPSVMSSDRTEHRVEDGPNGGCILIMLVDLEIKGKIFISLLIMTA